MNTTDLIQTSNVRALWQGLSVLRAQPKGHPALGAVIGQAGLGKTMSCHTYAAREGARYLVANALWTPRWMLNDLYEAIKHGVGRGLSRGDLLFSGTQRAYGECLALMDADRSPILIDEADRIASSTQQLETLRDLSDRTGTPIVFVGTDLVLRKLLQRDQFSSRLSQVVAFQRLTLEEVRLVADQLAGLTLADDAAQALLAASKGFFRDAVVGLAHLERATKSSKLSSPPAEMVAQICGRALRRAA